MHNRERDRQTCRRTDEPKERVRKRRTAGPTDVVKEKYLFLISCSFACNLHVIKIVRIVCVRMIVMKIRL